ncbi:MAG: hypothetical protein KIT34_16625 [Cyanobacteria bacterium TGS_CYA1]|nr:hypothetical protein [Cyanobacteria bacterium TGS_CYA1]
MHIQKLNDNAAESLRGLDEDSGIRGIMLFRVFKYPSTGTWQSWNFYTKNRILEGPGFIREIQWKGEGTKLSSTMPKIYHRALKISEEQVQSVISAIPSTPFVLVPSLPRPVYLDGDTAGIELFNTPGFQLTWNTLDGGPEQWKPITNFWNQMTEVFEGICSKSDERWRSIPALSE